MDKLRELGKWDCQIKHRMLVSKYCMRHTLEIIWCLSEIQIQLASCHPLKQATLKPQSKANGMGEVSQVKENKAHREDKK